MTYQAINLGSAPDDGTGDPLRTALDKVNDNFVELYARSGHLGYVADRFYGPARSNINTLAVAANIVYAVPIYVPRAVTIKALGLAVTTGAGATNAKLGIYSNTGARPDAKLHELAAPVSTATSSTSASGGFSANPTLDVGWYWLASLFDGTPTVNALRGSDHMLSFQFGGSDMLTLTATTLMMTGVSGASGAGTYTSGLPASFGASTIRTADTPLVGFQAVP